jgi:hypothetical protein
LGCDQGIFEAGILAECLGFEKLKLRDCDSRFNCWDNLAIIGRLKLSFNNKKILKLIVENMV